ncbi:MAG TPA: 50S ribosomal protein L37e [Candidatus Methanomethylophilaceae archaeon]|nr:50S ribosomal protein L37e [Candidatus Methanomethylophilaceae archaeon]
MGAGTAAQGKRNTKKVHIPCRRCGKSSYHVRKSVCSSCGYGKTAKLRGYNWAKSHE